ncbi:response regulator [Blautia schinkii]|nr:response regulator [Blautia schinkii]
MNKQLEQLEIVICVNENMALKTSALVEKLLEKYGAEAQMVLFNCAEKCLEYLEVHSPGIVILGMDIGETDGIELGEEILAININRRIDIVYVSGHPERAFEAFAVRPFAFVRESDFEKDMADFVERYTKTRLCIENAPE